MKFNYFFIFLLLNLQFVCSQSAAITIDGVFEDWHSGLTTYVDTNESISGVDLLEIQVTNDDEFLFIRIKADQEFDLTDDNTIIQEIGLFIDADNNTNTGFDIQQDYGSELGLLFTRLFAHYNVTPYSQVSMSDLKVRVAPTVSSDEFEIAIGRHVLPDGINALFPSSTIKILVKNDANFDRIPNIGNVFSYTFDETPVPAYTPIDINKDSTEHIRIVAYNTLFNGLLEPNRLNEFERIIKSLHPDIVGFVESYNTSEAYVKGLFDTWLPLGTAHGWYVAQHGGEVTVSRWEITQQWDHLTRQFPVLIDLPDAIYHTDLLFTNAHLSCCGADTSRQDQVDQYAAFILDAKTAGGLIDLPENTPFVYGGDLNLVGLAQQLETLKTGDIQDTATYGQGGFLDWDDTEVKEENTLQADVRMNYTWRSDSQAFPPGKLDFMLFSDFTLEAEKSFVLQTELMSTTRLTSYNLQQNDTETASDHFPVVTDFSIKTATVSPIVYLQGAGINPYVGQEALMRDDLRQNNLLPTTSPYQDAITCEASVFDANLGAENNDIVDWIYLELRDPNDAAQVKYARSALLQRDGDVVDIDGVSTAVKLNVPPADYYVAIRHRNHLGIMTIGATQLSESVVSINFSQDSNLISYGSNPQTQFGISSGRFAMWAGNVSTNDVIQYTGTNPDAPAILSEVLNDPGNFLNFPTFTISGYNIHDINMDGNVQYTGTTPDTPFILQNVLAHPGNFLNFSTYQIQEQLPEHE
ncbi:endonuclease/exonuclease/phosphatase family protein [Kordia sp. SMS9]|uniref:endonuclease/exonuclease/phosphatase family protein n=1 Tax=Kordia sp. SMS9 TaxID=2282170 RepID=UPI000E0D2B76|nr:endonuclease/exonuclease/phosphatase family protein [Kordia sp. SMS9]